MFQEDTLAIAASPDEGDYLPLFHLEGDTSEHPSFTE